MTKTLLAVTALAWAFGCSRGASQESTEPAASNGSDPAAQASPGTPVNVAVVAHATLAIRVSGPGTTMALEVQTIRAPFAGTLAELNVQDGDRVEKGQRVGYLVSRESVAALEGAREMERSARTPQEREDARRAIELAERSGVRAPLVAPAAGLVTAHQASKGSLVTQDQDLVSIAATGSVVFVVRLVQSDLPRVRPGQPASVEIPALHATLHGVVHSLLAASNSADFSAPARIDLARDRTILMPGLFGTATIDVGTRPAAQVVPASAVVRDDITGTKRVATVTAEDKAHWVEVATGIEQDGRVQIVSPSLAPQTRVITAGLVGLPEGASVQVMP